MAERSGQHGEGSLGNRLSKTVLAIAREAIRRLLWTQGGVEGRFDRVGGIGTNGTTLTMQADGRAGWNGYGRASGLVVMYRRLRLVGAKGCAATNVSLGD